MSNPRAPSLDLDWELGVFRGLRALWRRLRPETPPPIGPGAAHLRDLQPHLERMARLAGGQPVRVIEGKGAGGIRGLDLLFPPIIDLAPDRTTNEALYLLRALLGGVMAGTPAPDSPGARWEAELRAASHARNSLLLDLPNLAAGWAEAAALEKARRPPTIRGRGEHHLRHMLDGGVLSAVDYAEAATENEIPPPTFLWGRLYAVPTLPSTAPTAPDPTDTPRTPSAPTSEHAAPAVEDLHIVALDPRGEEKTLQHNFEKVETADSWQGNALKADGADELDEELEALDEVNLGDLVRGGPESHALLRADLGGGQGIPDLHDILPGETGLQYPEWDESHHRYRPAWCTVYPTRLGTVSAPAEAAARTVLAQNRSRIHQIVRHLLDLRAARRLLDRQRDGDHPDIDALTLRKAELKAGHSGDGRLYLRQIPRRREVATTILLDVSLSADAYQGEIRILDAARAATLCLAEAAHTVGDSIEILAFASHTRHRCRVWAIKERQEPWPKVRARLFALEAQGSTRIGPALRHATAHLSTTPAEGRLLLLIGDGKPTDHDRYEGTYGQSDVHHAVIEAEHQGIEVHTLALDPSARSLLPLMFGTQSTHQVDNLSQLPHILGQIWAKVSARAGA